MFSHGAGGGGGFGGNERERALELECKHEHTPTILVSSYKDTNPILMILSNPINFQSSITPEVRVSTYDLGRGGDTIQSIAEEFTGD